jgi:lipopolysaccharide export system protein LptA
LAALGFGIYWELQGSGGAPVAATTPKTMGAMTLPSSLPATGGKSMGPGERVWWDHYDTKNGERTSRIRMSRYQPAKDGSLFVNDPQAEFFMSEGRLLRIEGKTGNIVMQENLSKGKNTPGGGGMNQSPRSGDLHDVTLRMFRKDETAPYLTMTMNNASFDNETYRIQSEDYQDENGKRVRADWVPITVRGEYELDGYGLKLQYSDQDRRLVYLKIAHGKRLLIKHPGNLNNKPAAKPTGVANVFDAAPLVTPLLLTPDHWLLSSSLLVADTSPPTPRRPRPAQLPASRPKVPKEDEEPVYRAVFKDAVVVTQGGEQLATADQMDVDFINADGDMGGIGGSTTAPSATRPAKRATAEPRARAEQPVRPATRPAAKRAATSHPTTAPDEQPIEIHWTGPLTVTPVGGDKTDRIAPGESIVKLFSKEGRPVVVTRESNQVKNIIKCATLTHWTIDQGALLESGPGIPVEMMDSRQTHIITQTMLFSQLEGTALLYGKSHAELPIEDENTSTTKPTTQPTAPGKVQLMKVDWLDRCTLYFQGDLQEMVMDRADLKGQVRVDHPQVQLTSKDLDLHFANPPTTRPATKPATTQPQRSTATLRELDAKGNVHCVMQGNGGPADKQTIDTDNLRMLTATAPDGKLYAHNVIAIGQVHAVDPERDLKAGYMSITLAQPTTKPTTRPTTRAARQTGEVAAGDLETLIAHDAVHVITADGKTADADQLVIEVKNGKTEVTLHGRPAVVTRDKDKLIGAIIHMVPDTEDLSVTGAGRMDGVQKGAEGKPPRPVTVTWEKNLTGHGDLIECEGGVVARSTDADGTVNLALGRRVIITTTRPTTLPTTQPATVARAAGPATRPAAARKKATTRPGDLDAMGDRVVETLTLEGSAQTTSTLTDRDGNLLRLTHIDSEVIKFLQHDPKAKQLVIPGPGRMLMVDNRPPSTQPAAKEAAADPMGMRGQTAFQWGDSMVYDEGKQQAVMLGGVEITRVDPTTGQAQKADPMHLTGNTLIADIVPAPQSTTRPADGSELSSKMQLKKVHVEGSVHVSNSKLNLKAETMDYDPEKHRLTARGTPRNRVEQLDENGLPTASFDEFVWDTQTSQVVSSLNGTFIKRK